MNRNASLSPRHLADVRRRVQSVAQLRTQGVSAARAAAQCLPGGPWQQVLPGVYVLHPGPPTGDERLHAALLYAGRPPASRRAAPVRSGSGYGEGAAGLPRPVRVLGVPVAPVARALADAIAGLSDAATMCRMLTEAARGGHCEPAAVVRELSAAKLLDRPHVVEAVDAYWPEQAVAVVLSLRAHRVHGVCAAEREHLERLGITVVRVTPGRLKQAMGQQAVVARTALMAAEDREPAAYVMVLPR